ncbi:hypothetical protein DYB38_012008, partial [Aphanomyces astaci]
MINNLVAGRMFSALNNATPQMQLLEDKGHPQAAPSVPCSKTPTMFLEDAIDSIYWSLLIKFFPFDLTKSAPDLWDASEMTPSSVVPIFDQSCAGVLEAAYFSRRHRANHQ